MTRYLHELDDSRPVTCGINIFFNFLSSMGFGVYSDEKAEKQRGRAPNKAGKEEKKPVGSEFYNKLACVMGDKFMKFGATLYPCDVKTRDAYANMDIAGYNYGIWRYRKDLKKYPEPLILGSRDLLQGRLAVLGHRPGQPAHHRRLRLVRHGLHRRDRHGRAGVRRL